MGTTNIVCGALVDLQVDLTFFKKKSDLAEVCSLDVVVLLTNKRTIPKFKTAFY
jgi:hypothetical protein